MKYDDVLGDEGRAKLHACVKVTIMGKPEKRYYSKRDAIKRIMRCYNGPFPISTTSLFPTKSEEIDTVMLDINDIHKELNRIDQLENISIYPKKSSIGYKHRMDIIDEMRKSIESEFIEAKRDIEFEHGSGFIIENHFIITNAHVEETVRFNENYHINITNEIIGQLERCHVAYFDQQKDLALLYCPELNIEKIGISPLRLSDKSMLPGMSIFSFGYPISHTGKTALFMKGYVSGTKQTLSGHQLAVLNCPLNSGNSGGPILCREKDEIRVIGVACQKHIKEILKLDEILAIENIRETLKTKAIADVNSDQIVALEDQGSSRNALDILTLKLYDALEIHSQFNLSNAIPSELILKFLAECATQYKGEHKVILIRLNALLTEETQRNTTPSAEIKSMLSNKSDIEPEISQIDRSEASIDTFGLFSKLRDLILNRFVYHHSSKVVASELAEYIIQFVKANSSELYNAQFYVERGISKIALKEYQPAIADFNEAIRLEPENGSVFVRRAEANRMLGNTNAAIADLDEAIRLNPKNGWAYSHRGRAKLELKQYQSAIKDLNVAIRLDPKNGWAYGQRGIAKIQLKQYPSAIADLNEAISLDCLTNLWAYYGERGRAKRKLEQYQPAIADFDEAIRLNPKDAFAYGQRGVANRMIGKYKFAITDFDTAIQIKPTDYLTYTERGAAKIGLKEYLSAIADFNEAIRLNPMYKWAFAQRGNAKIGLKQYETAIADLDEAIRLDSKFEWAYIKRADAKIVLKQYQSAITDLDEAIRLNSKDASSYTLRGTAKIGLEKYQSAIADLDEALRYDPKYGWAYGKRASAKIDLKQCQSAIADLDEAIRIDSINAWYYYGQRSRAKTLLKQYQSANADYDEALRLNPEGTHDYLQHYYITAFLESNSDLVESLSENLELVEGNISTATVHTGLGRFNSANEDFKEAIRLDLMNEEEYKISLAESEFNQQQKPTTLQTPPPSSLPTFFPGSESKSEDKLARIALQIAKRAVMQAHRELKFSDTFKSSLIKMIKEYLLQNEEQMIEKLEGARTVNLRKSIAGKIAQEIINDIDANATDATEYDYVIEDAIAEWKDTDDDWRQIYSGMQKH